MKLRQRCEQLGLQLTRVPALNTRNDFLMRSPRWCVPQCRDDWGLSDLTSQETQPGDAKNSLRERQSLGMSRSLPDRGSRGDVVTHDHTRQAVDVRVSEKRLRLLGHFLTRLSKLGQKPVGAIVDHFPHHAALESGFERAETLGSKMAVAVVAGYASGVLEGLAIVSIAAFAGICIGYDRARALPAQSWKRRLAIGLNAFGILVLGLLLGMHVLPGFHNFLVLDNVVFSSGAAPYTLYLNFDKTLVGVFILGLCHQPLLRRGKQWAEAFRRAAPIVPIHIALVAVGAAAIGYLTWQPKWVPLFAVWAPVNLFFVCLSEEAVFRGFIQRS